MDKEQIIFQDDWPYSKAKTVLLRSAALVMREKGPRSATLKNISLKAGVTEPAIFRHFDGVNGLFQSLFDVVVLFKEHFQSFYNPSGLIGLERLEYQNMRVVNIYKNNPDYAYIITNADTIFKGYPKLVKKLDELKQKETSLINSCMREAKNKSQLNANADPDTVIKCFSGAFNNIVAEWLVNPVAASLEKETRKTWSSIVALVKATSWKPATIELSKDEPAKKAAPAKSVPAKAAPKKAPAKTAAAKPKAASKPATAKKTATKTTAKKPSTKK